MVKRVGPQVPKLNYGPPQKYQVKQNMSFFSKVQSPISSVKISLIPKITRQCQWWSHNRVFCRLDTAYVKQNHFLKAI